MKDVITVTAIVNADVKKTWDYYTNPNHIVHWNFADASWHCPTAENDMQVGGRYKARMEAKDGSFGFDFEAVYTEVNIGEGFTYEFGGRTANVQFKSANHQTEIIVAFEPESQNAIELQKSGWQAILDNFKSYTENN
jgi:uncharacterized protein YndB with AHSA1/START domain